MKVLLSATPEGGAMLPNRLKSGDADSPRRPMTLWLWGATLDPGGNDIRKDSVVAVVLPAARHLTSHVISAH